MPEKVLNEIKRLGAKNIIITEGKESVSEDVEKKLSSLGLKVRRIAGDDRYSTSEQIAREIHKVKPSVESVLSNGAKESDALSISSYAAKKKIPILLVKKDVVPTKIENYIKDAKVSDALIIGGEESVSTKVKNYLGMNKSNNGFDIKSMDRIGGVDRYHTSAMVATKLFNDSKEAYMASGENNVDALVIGPVAGKENRPILLSKAKSTPDPIKELLNKYNVTLIAGENSINVFK